MNIFIIVIVYVIRPSDALHNAVCSVTDVASSSK